MHVIDYALIRNTNYRIQDLYRHLLLDAYAEGDGALGLVAGLGVVAAQRDELLADGAAPVRLALAANGVCHDALHLPAGLILLAVGKALAGVHQGLDAPLDGDFPAAVCVCPALHVRALARPDDGTLILHHVFCSHTIVPLECKTEGEHSTLLIYYVCAINVHWKHLSMVGNCGLSLSYVHGYLEHLSLLAVTENIHPCIANPIRNLKLGDEFHTFVCLDVHDPATIYLQILSACSKYSLIGRCIREGAEFRIFMIISDVI